MSLDYLLDSEVKKLKDNFKDLIEQKLKAVITDNMSEKHVNSLRKYIISSYLAGSKSKRIPFESIAIKRTQKIDELTKENADPLFVELTRDKHISAANSRYLNNGYGLLGTNNRRLYFPIDNIEEKSKTEIKVTDYLKEKGYKIRDYKEKYAYPISGIEQIRIGKLLTDNPKLAKEYTEDKDGYVSADYLNKSEYLLVLSDRPSDIAYMSTRRANWTSCMANDDRDELYKNIPDEIANGSIIAYLVKKDDPNIYKPLSRILLKPYYNRSGEVIYDFKKCYGLKYQPFINKVKKALEEISSKKPDIYFMPDIYDDKLPKMKLVKPSEIKAEDFLEAINVKFDKNDDGTIIAKSNIDISDMKLKELPNLSNVIVKGEFNCSKNYLTSLKGSPINAQNGFICKDNYLESLDHCSESQSGIYATNNPIKSLKGAPKKFIAIWTDIGHFRKHSLIPKELLKDPIKNKNQVKRSKYGMAL